MGNVPDFPVPPVRGWNGGMFAETIPPLRPFAHEKAGREADASRPDGVCDS